MNHLKHIQAHLEVLAGVNTVVRGDVKIKELSPKLVKLFTENEKQIQDWLEKDERLHKPETFGYVTQKLMVFGESFYNYEFKHFQENKQLYTSPLYKALL